MLLSSVVVRLVGLGVASLGVGEMCIVIEVAHDSALAGLKSYVL